MIDLNPSELQCQASNPFRHVWVEANAGSGKTKVLVDRFMRLLLEHVAPEKILCVTYTNAAAAEMAERIRQRCERWSNITIDDLTSELQELTGIEPNHDIITHARSLLAKILDTRHGLKIYTLHGFCQLLLAKFPLEAGIYPDYQILENDEKKNIIIQIFHQLSDKSHRYHDVFTAFCHHMRDDEIVEIINSLSIDRAYIINSNHIPNTVLKDTLCHILKIDNDTAANYLYKHCQDTAQNFNFLGLKRLANLYNSSKTERDINNSHVLSAFLKQSPAERAAILANPKKRHDYLKIFMTAQWQILKRPPAILKEHPDLIDIINHEYERLCHLYRHYEALIIVERSLLLQQVIGYIYHEFQTLKANYAKLDYDDMVHKTSELLRNDDAMVSWVMYKLDSGIDHLLVDEAQDLSHLQWSVLHNLFEWLITGYGQQKSQYRSVFVVGDFKQSIYSFQGAAPDIFSKTKNYITDLIKESHDNDFQKTYKKADQKNLHEPLYEVPMQTSFRSAPIILNFVDHVMQHLQQQSTHYAFHHHYQGRVEVMPLIDNRNDDDNSNSKKSNSWQVPSSESQKIQKTGKEILADAIAYMIKKRLDDGYYLASVNRAVQARDIMILVEKRDYVTSELLKSLYHYDIPVAGIDRQLLGQHIAVKDILYIIRFLLLPHDDFNMACLLKTPYCDCDDNDLLEYASKRDSKSLWQYIQELAAKNEKKPAKICDFLQDKMNYYRDGKLLDFIHYFLHSKSLVKNENLSVLQSLLYRLGYHAKDVIDAFLETCYHFHQQHHIYSIQDFLQWLDNEAIEFKRESNQKDNQHGVRILTMHGAKGLESPWVIIAQTHDNKNHNRIRDKIIISQQQYNHQNYALLLWDHLTKSDINIPILERFKDEHLHIMNEEHIRLLYVAMTRAESLLSIFGLKPANSKIQHHWYNILYQTMENHPNKKMINNYPYWQHSDDTVLFISDEDETQQISPYQETVTAHNIMIDDNIFWRDIKQSDALYYQHDDDHFDFIRSPIDDERPDPFLRGRVIHRLLEYLPDIGDDKRLIMMDKMLSQGEAIQLPQDARDDIRKKITMLFTQSQFQVLFSQDSMAEVTLSAKINIQENSDIEEAINLRIDRLWIKDNNILILDYKSLRPPPISQDNIHQRYKQQLSLYKRVLSKIYPQHQVTTAILWIDNLDFMIVDC